MANSTQTTHGHPDERLSDLFVPDTMLPSQYFDRLGRRHTRGGEHRLMLAILEDAVDVYRKQAGARDARRQAMFAEAETWIESTDRTWIFSFENICEALGIEVEYLRRGLRAWKKNAGAAAVTSRAEVVPLHPRTVMADDEPLAKVV